MYQWRLLLQSLLFWVWDLVHLYDSIGIQDHADCFIDSACAARTSGNANFAITASGVTASGTCIAGYLASGGTPTSVCSNTVWGAVSNPCTRTRLCYIL